MLLEICIDRLASARAAREGGADRLEVCGELSAGGVTPSVGLVEACLALDGPAVMMMIRPHGGSFFYESDDVAVMLGDLRTAARLRVKGVVFGALTSDRRVDVETCRRLIDAARPLEVTFHRAFDLVRDPREALDALLDLGVDRLLTSGCAATAVEGAAVIRQLVTQAAGRLAVMPGAGVRGANVAELVRSTGVREVHASASETRPAAQTASFDFLGAERVTTVENVRAIRAALATRRASEV